MCYEVAASLLGRVYFFNAIAHQIVHRAGTIDHQHYVNGRPARWGITSGDSSCRQNIVIGLQIIEPATRLVSATIAADPEPGRPDRRVRPRGDSRAIGDGWLAVQINCRATRGPC